MATPTTGPYGSPLLDNFDRADGDPGANWTGEIWTGEGKALISGGVVKGTADGASMVWNVAKFGAAQEAWGKLNWNAWEIYFYLGVTAVPLTTAGAKGYYVRFRQALGWWAIYRDLAGSDTTLKTVNPSTFDQHDYAALVRKQSGANAVLEVWRWPDGGSAWALVDSYTDTSAYLDDGYLGTELISGSTEFDEFGGGTITPVNTVAPAVSGTAQVGQTLSTTNGTWSGSPTSYGYQWQRDNSGGGVYSNIGGATSSSYTLVSADLGCNVRCVVTATNAAGSTSANSNAVGPVAAAPASTPSQPSLPALIDTQLRFTAVLLRDGAEPLTLTRSATMLRYSTIANGGFGSCDLELPGKPEEWTSSIPYQAMLRVCYGTRIVFEGRVEDKRLSIGSGFSTKISLYGLKRRLEDESIRRIWSMRGVPWQANITSLGGLTGYGTNAIWLDPVTWGSVVIGAFDPTDLTRSGVAIGSNGTVPPGVGIANGVQFYTEGVEIVKLYLDAIRSGNDPIYYCVRDSVDGSTWNNKAADALSGTKTSLAITPTAGAQWLRLIAALDTAIANLNSFCQYENIRLLGTSLTEDVAGAIYGGKIIRDLVSLIPGLVPGVIDAGDDFALPSCEALQRRSALAILEEIVGYYTREWGVWEEGRFDWRQPNLDETQWIANASDLLPGSEIVGSLDGTYRRVFVQYMDAGGGYQTEQSAVTQDQRNPFAGGISNRDLLHSVNFPMTTASALQLANKLATLVGSFPTVTGRLILPARKLVQHATNGPSEAFLVRAGDNITVPDLPKSDPLAVGRDGETHFHIASTDIDLAGGKITLEVEGGVKTIDALMARLSAATRVLTG